MAKYIKKCYKCNELFEQEINPKDFKVMGLCGECKKEIKIYTLGESPILIRE